MLEARPASFVMVSPDYWELSWVASKADPVVDIDDEGDVKSITSWVIVGNELDLLPGWIAEFHWEFLLKHEHPQFGALQPKFGRFQPQKQDVVQILNSGGIVQHSLQPTNGAMVGWLAWFAMLIILAADGCWLNLHNSGQNLILRSS